MLKNLKEDAYWVHLNLSFPQGLSFRKVEVLKVSAKAGPAWGHACPHSFCSPGRASGRQHSLELWAAAGVQKP